MNPASPLSERGAQVISIDFGDPAQGERVFGPDIRERELAAWKYLAEHRGRRTLGERLALAVGFIGLVSARSDSELMGVQSGARPRSRSSHRLLMSEMVRQ
jgi:hypothetical protein